MKLETRFKALEPTAFAEWLAKFQELFSPEELKQDIEKIQPNKIKEYYKKISALKDERMKLNYELIPTNEIGKKIAQLEREAKDVSL